MATQDLRHTTGTRIGEAENLRAGFHRILLDHGLVRPGGELLRDLIGYALRLAHESNGAAMPSTWEDIDYIAQALNEAVWGGRS